MKLLEYDPGVVPPKAPGVFETDEPRALPLYFALSIATGGAAAAADCPDEAMTAAVMLAACGELPRERETDSKRVGVQRCASKGMYWRVCQ